jgi:glycogen debranching enzyme
MFSGWGVRTLSAGAASYNPVSYHNGSVWPHDNALIVAGLMRYGFVEHAHRITDALLDVSTHHGGRLPELLAGTDRAAVGVPVSYPTSCMPQAWAAATPLLLLRSLLRLDPWMGWDQVWISPAPLADQHRLSIRGVHLGEHRVSIDADGKVGGLPDSVVVHHEPRFPLTRSTSP